MFLLWYATEKYVFKLIQSREDKYLSIQQYYHIQTSKSCVQKHLQAVLCKGQINTRNKNCRLLCKPRKFTWKTATGNFPCVQESKISHVFL